MIAITTQRFRGDDIVRIVYGDFPSYQGHIGIIPTAENDIVVFTDDLFNRMIESGMTDDYDNLAVYGDIYMTRTV